jgi:hypothetical protein
MYTSSGDQYMANQDRVSAARERFVSLAEARTRRAIKDIRLIGNLSNRSNYSYQSADVVKIFKALESELKTARQKFESPRGGDKDVEFTLA